VILAWPSNAFLHSKVLPSGRMRTSLQSELEQRDFNFTIVMPSKYTVSCKTLHAFHYSLTGRGKRDSK